MIVSFEHMRVFPIEQGTCSVAGLLGVVMRERARGILAEPLPQPIGLLIAALVSRERRAPVTKRGGVAGTSAETTDAPAEGVAGSADT